VTGELIYLRESGLVFANITINYLGSSEVMFTIGNHKKPGEEAGKLDETVPLSPCLISDKRNMTNPILTFQV
jgi:tRNA pseudouridine-54 N-methylase